jgi:hypothetical protein
MGLYRCYNLACSPVGVSGVGRDFEANEPVCPGCKQGPPAVQPLVAVHWLIPTADGKIVSPSGRYRVACQPQRADLARMHASERPEAVTCPACRKAGENFERLLAEFREANQRGV